MLVQPFRSRHTRANSSVVTPASKGESENIAGIPQNNARTNFMELTCIRLLSFHFGRRHTPLYMAEDHYM